MGNELHHQIQVETERTRNAELTPISTDLALLAQGLQSGSSSLGWPVQGRRPPATPLTVGSKRRCADCGATLGTVPRPPACPPGYRWQVCACQAARIAARDERMRARGEARRQAEADVLLGDTGMSKIAHMTLDTFDPGRLDGDEQHPYRVATAWLARLLEYGQRGNYRDPAAPATALFFYCPGKGRGKTHLASGILWAARRHRLTAFVEETSYIDRSWSCPMEQKEALAALPGERAWLTVVDDLGRREIGQSAAGVQNAWAALFVRRWLAVGWTIITSNWTLDELVSKRTIDEALYSRIKQMTRGEYVFFDGQDVRLEGI